MNELKSISEIAKELNVSRQAVYLKLKNNDLSEAVKPFTERQGNVTRYTNQGIQLIKDSFTNSSVKCDFTEELKSLTDNLTESQENCQELSKNLNTCQIELDKALKEVQELKRINSELTAKASVNDSLTKKCGILESNCQRLEKDLSECRTQIDELKADKAKLNERLDKAESDRTELIESNKELTIALKAAQALHGMDKQQKAIETVQAVPESESQPASSEPQEPPRELQQPPKKRTLSERIRAFFK